MHIMFPNAGSVLPYLRSGKLRGLAVTGANPSALAPGLPAVAASVPGYDATANLGVLAPARTGASIVNRLNQEIVRFVDRADVKERFLSAGLEIVGSSPEQFAAIIKSEMARLGKAR